MSLSQFGSSEKGLNRPRGSLTSSLLAFERSSKSDTNTTTTATEAMGPPNRRNSQPIAITNNSRPSSKHANSRTTNPDVQSGSFYGSGHSSSPSSSTSSAPNTAWNLGVQRRDRKLWTSLRERIEADVGVETLTTVELEEILKQMLSVTLPNPSIRSEELASVMTALAQDLPISSGLLCSEFTRFVHKACTKEKILLTSTQLNGLLQFFLSFIKTTATWYTASAIRALGLLLHDNSDHIVTAEGFETLFAVLLQYLDPSGVDIEARYAATSCVSNICAPAAQSPHIDGYFATLLRMVVENVRQQAQRLMMGENERMVVKACTCSLKCIYTIVSVHYERLADRIEAQLPGLLSSMRQVLGHGLILTPSSISEQRPGRMNTEMVFTYQKELPPSDSDSSLCGSDGGNGKGGQSGDGLLARLRITVLHTLEAIAQHFPRTITSSVGLYLPEQTTPYMTLYNHTPSVLTLLVADPCERVRIAAARFLDAFWDQIPLKQYFRHSQSVVAPSTSFASMPKRISYMLYQVHVTLVYGIQNEKEGSSLIQVLKTTASVVQHCPYASVCVLLQQSDLRPPMGDVLKALASSLYAATSSSDHSIRMAGIACFSALLNVTETLPALSAWMISRTSAKTTIDVANITILCGTSALSKRSFVEELLMIASRPDDASQTLMRLEAMSLLSKVAKNYPIALCIHWKRLQDFMTGSFQDMDPNVRLQAVKILENYIKGESMMTSSVRPPSEDGESMIGILSAVSTRRQDCLDFMATHLIRAFHDTSHHVRASVCACFTLLGPQDWVYVKGVRPTSRLAVSRANGGRQPKINTTTSSLDSYTRIFLQTPQDSSPVVRAAGFRLLGSLCLAPTFKTRELAIAVVSASLDALSDSTLNVRVRAAWALGNVCTTPGPETVIAAAASMSLQAEGAENLIGEGVATSPAPVPVLYEILPAYQLRNIVEKMLVYIGDNDKVVSSVARTLGLVCRWAYFEPFIATVSMKEANALQELVGQMMTVLSTKINSGSPKVRWNACHAIAKVLLCPDLPLALVHWAPTVFQALISAIIQQENFKVRISACSALRVPVSRSAYGAFFRAALNATLDALETASDLKDVTAFRYKEQLETQLSFTLVHLVHVATVEDDCVIWEALSAKPPSYLYDWLFHNLHRMTAAMEKESEVPLSGAGQDVGEEGGEGGGESGSGASGSTEMHDVIPIKKDELLSAIRTLLRVLQNQDVSRIYSKQCLSILYDAKLSLERDVLYSNEDLAFEF